MPRRPRHRKTQTSSSERAALDFVLFCSVSTCAVCEEDAPTLVFGCTGAGRRGGLGLPNGRMRLVRRGPACYRHEAGTVTEQSMRRDLLRQTRSPDPIDARSGTPAPPLTPTRSLQPLLLTQRRDRNRQGRWQCAAAAHPTPGTRGGQARYAPHRCGVLLQVTVQRTCACSSPACASERGADTPSGMTNVWCHVIFLSCRHNV